MAKFFLYYYKIFIPKFFFYFKDNKSLEVPKINKVILSMGLGKHSKDKKAFYSFFYNLGLISLQRPIIAKAKKSISNFKIRKGFPMGIKVTLRKKKMYYFLDKLINFVLPNIKNFKGLDSRGFDNNANYNFGLKSFLVFPEIFYSDNTVTGGLNISIITSTSKKRYSKFLLKSLNIPFKKYA